MFAQVFDPEDSLGNNNTWIYDRAPEGYKFVLDNMVVSTTQKTLARDGLVAIYDGHEYTHWNQWPGVESKELLGRVEVNVYNYNETIILNGWECKEFTLGIRSTSEENSFKICLIVWYYLRKMSWLEKLQYAVMQPRGQRYRKGGATTVERSEA